MRRGESSTASGASEWSPRAQLFKIRPSSVRCPGACDGRAPGRWPPPRLLRTVLPSACDTRCRPTTSSAPAPETAHRRDRWKLAGSCCGAALPGDSPPMCTAPGARGKALTEYARAADARACSSATSDPGSAVGRAVVAAAVNAVVAVRALPTAPRSDAAAAALARAAPSRRDGDERHATETCRVEISYSPAADPRARAAGSTMALSAVGSPRNSQSYTRVRSQYELLPGVLALARACGPQRDTPAAGCSGVDGAPSTARSTHDRRADAAEPCIALVRGVLAAAASRSPPPDDGVRV